VLRKCHGGWHVCPTLVWLGAGLTWVRAPGCGTTAAALCLGDGHLTRSHTLTTHKLIIAQRRPRVCTKFEKIFLCQLVHAYCDMNHLSQLAKTLLTIMLYLTNLIFFN